ncbi:MAG: hypothetical protein ACRDRL_24360 [Sciscionella sp.]
MTLASPPTPKLASKLASEFRAAVRMFDGFDVIFGLLLWFTTFVAAVTWTSMIGRALRGEEVEQGSKETATAALAIAAWSIASSSHFRTAARSTESVAETRATVHDMRNLINEMNTAVLERDARAAKRDDHTDKQTRTMLGIAGLTLLVSVIALAVTLLSR